MLPVARQLAKVEKLESGVGQSLPMRSGSVWNNVYCASDSDRSRPVSELTRLTKAL
jgi:hypothetical protein